MKNIAKSIALFGGLILSLIACGTSNQHQVDILVVGGGVSGVAAGVQAARMGSDVLIVEESTWLGGMLTSAGVSAIDGNYKLPSGIWGEFRDSLVAHYGHLDSLKTGWVSKVLFEPSVGNGILKKIVSNEKNLHVHYRSLATAITKVEGGWLVNIVKDGQEQIIKTKILIDATELGDIAKMAGVAYSIGMDSRDKTGEHIAPQESNNIIQDLTYVAILKDYGKDVTIEKPEGYNSSLFACAAVNDLCISPKEPHRMWSKDRMIVYGKLPNNKYMINWPIEGNDYYLNLIELSGKERTEELKKAKNFTMQFVYFIQKELGYSNLGLADDEFPSEDLLPLMPYHRESRRIQGAVQFGLNHITDPYTQPEKLYRTSVAVGDYPVDHHHKRYNDYDNLPDLYFYPVPSYGLPLGTMIPQDVDNLIVGEKSISVTNLVNGTTRLQPVVLQIGQATGTLAALAVQQNVKVRDVLVRDVQRSLLEVGGYLLPYLDVDKKDDNFLVYQRIGVTGILKGVGKNVDWSNETWLRISDPLKIEELEGFFEFYDLDWVIDSDTQLTYGLIAKWIEKIGGKEQSQAINLYISDKDLSKTLTRGEFAIMIDTLLNPFETKEVDIKGNFIK